MNRIPTRRSPFARGLAVINLSSWSLGAVCACAFFALLALAGEAPDSEAVPAVQLEDLQQQRERDLVLLAEVGQIAREAHAQGMREALASVQGTPDGDALQKTCGQLWNLEHAQ